MKTQAVVNYYKLISGSILEISDNVHLLINVYVRQEKNLAWQLAFIFLNCETVIKVVLGHWLCIPEMFYRTTEKQNQ